MFEFFGPPFASEPPPHHNVDLRIFIAHMFRECMLRYRNDTDDAAAAGGVTPESDNATGTILDIMTAAPTYLEEAIFNEGVIDVAHLDLEAAERNEYYATVRTMTANDSAVATAVDNFCPVDFDGYLCWPRTLAGSVVTQNCPDFVEGFNSRFLAFKTCMENGSWYRHPVSGLPWSNYTNCVDYEDFHFRSLVNELYVDGYILSLVSLIMSLIIFLGFKSLRCTRIRIHVHLFASLALTCVAWLLWYKFVVEHSDYIRHNPIWCILLHLIVHYLMLVNYFWMFCEGLHLHMVLVVVFVKDTVVMRYFIMFAWLLPLVFVSVYSVARMLHPDDNANCWMDDSLLLWIFSVPICLSLLASFVFLINVLRVIVRKLHPQSAQPAPLAIRKAVRATIILIPLFGLQHFLLPYRPDSGTRLERFYQLLSVVLVSLQGFVVSFLFCFANHDVTFAIRSLFNRLMPTLVAPPPASSNTGQVPTTTPSRELGV